MDDIEEIEKLQACYVRVLGARDQENYARIFASDVVFDTGGGCDRRLLADGRRFYYLTDGVNAAGSQSFPTEGPLQAVRSKITPSLLKLLLFGEQINIDTSNGAQMDLDALQERLEGYLGRKAR